MGEAVSLDTAALATAIQPLIEQLQDELDDSLVHARAADSERLDNTIHGIIDATRNEEFKERLTRLDQEIHRVFDAVAAASVDPENVRALELMEGIVVLSSIMNAIAEARIDQGAGETGTVAVSGAVVVASEGEEGITVTGAGFDPGERVIISVAHTAFAAVIVEGSLLNEQISANETGAFQATGTLPLGAGVYTLEATGADSSLRAVTPLVVAE